VLTVHHHLALDSYRYAVGGVKVYWLASRFLLGCWCCREEDYYLWRKCRHRLGEVTPNSKALEMSFAFVEGDFIFLAQRSTFAMGETSHYMHFCLYCVFATMVCIRH
jgi:hypothetical protein